MAEKQKCLMCLNEKSLNRFYKSKSNLHSNKVVPYCKDCLNSLNLFDTHTLIDTLQKIDVPYVKKFWDNVVEQNIENPSGLLGKYLKIIAIQFSDKTFKDSDIFEENMNKLMKLDEKINSKEKKLNKLENKIEENKKIKENNDKELKLEKEFDIEALQEKWGLEFKPSDCIAFEKKFQYLKDAIPNQTKLHIETLITYIRYQVKAEQAIAEGNADDAKKWGELARNSAKQAKITPEQLTSADLSQGIDSFSTLVREVEKAVDIIPLMPELIYTPKDKADMIIHTYINYERDLHGLPPVEYKDVYNFYNEQIENYIKEFPETYAFLKDGEVEGDTQVERVYNFIFKIVIPKKKKENPESKFYQNLEKWVELVSYWRFYPDMWYDIISPNKKNGSKKGVKLSLDQRVNLRGMARFKHFHAVLSRGSGKCVVGDTLLFTNDGIKEIGSYFDYQNDDIETIKEQNITMLNMNGELETSPKSIYSGYKDTKKIKLKFGYEIEATLNHKLLVKDNQGEIKWKEVKNLQLDDCLCVNKENDIWGNNTNIPFDIDEKINELDLWNNDKAEMPKEILISKKEIVGKFINKLHNKYGYSLGIKSKSEKFIKQLQIIWLNLGTITNITFENGYYYLTLIINEYTEFDENNNRRKNIFLPMEEIISSKNDVYDVYMPKTNSFIGNGIVNHNTFLNQMFFIHSAIFYPDTSLALSAQTKENSASLISSKFKELTKFYPILEKEYYPAPKSSIESKTNVLIKFKSGGEIDNLVNAQSSKGQRRRKLVVEESAQINNKTFVDVLEPIPNVARKTIGDMTIDSPVEMHGQIHFFTTSWFRSTAEFERCLKFFDDMINLRGVFILGASYELNLLAERGESKSTILAKKESDPIFFALNYESKWIGAGEGALISIDKMMDLRNIEIPETKSNNKNEYVISVDVARSSNANNNQSSICILKITRKKSQAIQNVSVVNIINYPSNKSFEELAIEIKKLKIRFDAKMIVIDTNGVGKGLLDYMGKEQFDSLTNESLGCYKPFNDSWESADYGAEELIYAVNSQHINKDIIINFQDFVENGKLRLLKKANVMENQTSYTDNEIEDEVAPFVQTDLLINEVANLKLEITDNNVFKVIRLSRRIDKDRYSALAYGLYYIKKFEEQNQTVKDFNIKKYFLFKK